MRRIKLEISYDGTNYSGWQKQPDVPTVQGTLELTLREITKEDNIAVTGSGRTDAGVHALKQVAAFTTQTALPPDVFLRALNGLLPLDIRILNAAEVALDFHPISDATGKRYRYLIDDNRPCNPFTRNYTWIVRKPLDENVIRDTAQPLLGQHDFKCFQTTGSPRKTTVRTVTDVLIQRIPSTVLTGGAVAGSPLSIEIQANGFLYNMMRAIAGTLVDLYIRGKEQVLSLTEIIESGDRSLAGQTAPPHGLYLLDVFY
ncbi:MAG: tRNA pseudouridine(38-40) synthase TruA [Planctomycetaceae bacterium]|jgi:tRNA pseudouridine38-40 synthase|nr:tRNA pseudouridine(38-40) synthase TruA [Planctomycetaceae bacterium]